MKPTHLQAYTVKKALEAKMQYTTKDRLARIFDDNPKLAKKIIRMKKSWDEISKLLNTDQKSGKKK